MRGSNIREESARVVSRWVLRRSEHASEQPPHLGCLQILQHKVPQLGRGVQQQELEAGRSDAGGLSRFRAGDIEVCRERPSSPLVLSHFFLAPLWPYSIQLSFLS